MDHNHTHEIAGGMLRTAFLLTIAILLVEAGAGLLSHSLALLSDAGHVLTDIVALGLAWFAAVQAERPATDRKTYGYHRTGILAALANAVTLVAIVLVIAYEAVRRLQHPEPVIPWLMFISAGVGIVINLFIGLALRKAGADNLNVRAALLHVVGDVAASSAVILAGIVILLTGWYPADPLLSLVIAALIAKSAWGILLETVDILMEATPKDLDLPQLVRDMVTVPAVQDVHDLHVWSIAGGMRMLSAHVQVGEDCHLSSCDALQVTINRMLEQRYRIGHTTLQFECAGCDPSSLYCTLGGVSNGAYHHHHGTLDGRSHDEERPAQTAAGC